MRRILPVLAVLLSWTASLHATGIVIPDEKYKLPPLAMLNHNVKVGIEDQATTTTIKQTFRNHTSQRLEATYVFPVPKGASVNKFKMKVNGKDMEGELLKAEDARATYTKIVRQTQDPGLLEYVGGNLFRMRVFPIEPNSDQEVSLSFTSVANKDSGLVEYVYPLKTDGKKTQTLKEFSVEASIKSQHGVQNVYSPTHAIRVDRVNDKEVKVVFEKEQAILDKDFQLFYSEGGKNDVGLTAVMHRPISKEDGHFMLLMTPTPKLSESSYVPRDMVFVLDTSGSMNKDNKIEQARKALTFMLTKLKPEDRFGLINFSTSVNKYREKLVDASSEQVEHATKWVEKLKATGGTAINDALAEAMEMRSEKDDARTFTIVFFTDGQPTIGETNIDKIIKNVESKNSANTRIFTFGVGEEDDINATLLDQLAERTRALSTFVRSKESIDEKVASLYTKISHPVMANIKLTTGSEDIKLTEMYPPQIPDMFHGGQVMVFGRYTGKGPVAIKLNGQVGKEKKEFVYELNFAEKTSDDKAFVEDLWARRKVGYLLDQIRLNGEKKELKDSVVELAKKYGIATIYTSWLVVPDGPMPVAQARAIDAKGGETKAPIALRSTGSSKPGNVKDFAKKAKSSGGAGGGLGREREAQMKNEASAPSSGYAPEDKNRKDGLAKMNTYGTAMDSLRKGDHKSLQINAQGVELSVQTNNLRNQSRLEQNAQRRVASRNCIEVGGVWIDEGFDAKTETVTVKAMSDAYFRILELFPETKDVFRLGNHLVWMTPSGKALVIDTNEGSEKMTDEDIKKLFTKA